MSRYSQRTKSDRSAQPVYLHSVEAAYTSLRRTQRGLASMLFACAILGLTVLKTPPGTLGSKTYLPIIFSTTLLTFAYTIRNVMVLPSLSELRQSPRDEKVLKRWTRNNLIVQSLCGCVGLIGFAMQLLGAATMVSLTLYVISISYLFLLRPVRP